MLVDKAKSNYFRNILNNNKTNIKKFTDNTSNSKVIPNFVDPIANTAVPQCDVPDFLNQFFVDISARLNIDNTALNLDNYIILPHYVDVLSSNFEHDLPDRNEVLLYANLIDLSRSSSVKSMSTKVCVDLIKSIPDIICCIFSTSMSTGIFPRIWSNCVVTLLPKPGDLSDPGNWRPITQTSIFAKLFDKLNAIVYIINY